MMREYVNQMDGLWGLMVGDALGVPAEFKDREMLRRMPVMMMTGFGTHWQEVGTWSDDTSMTLATMDSLCRSLDYENMMKRFKDWLFYNKEYTPHGEVFDVGGVCRRAIRDVIEWQLDDVLDINGWDLKKVLQLLHKSNPTVFEWCASPIVYYQTEEFEELKKILPEFFSVKKSLFHYWHMAETHYREYLKGEEVRLKKYFYALRPLLAAKWIVDKQVAPPMLFDELVSAELEPALLPEVERLLEMKKNLPEMEKGPKVHSI